MPRFFYTLATIFVVQTLASAQTFTHAEARHTHSIALTPDGTRLLALNSADARLSVFAVDDAGNAEPVLLAEIPVGLEPVAVRARTDDEVWVVNELSDSVSVVSLSAGAVVATLRAADEPADVIFAQGRAFVTCARNNLVRVFDATTRAELPAISVQGLVPSALAANAAGTLVYAAFLHSGNGTTILPASAAPAPPAPTNPNLPAAPRTGLIVAANDSRIAYTVLDRDVVEIDAVTAQVVRYFSGAGTNLFDVAVQPQSGDVWVANSEARNLVRFEPVLRGHVADHRLTRLTPGNGAATIFDLNPGVNYATLPNPAAQNTALAQPTELTFSSDGATAWVAAFGSDRVAKITAATGTVQTRIELRSTGETSRQMRGPRALALHPMKGPMTTQTLRGMTSGAPFHWRGDRATLQSFNATFDKLMGGAQLAPADIDALAAYLLTLRNHPNPNLRRDGTPPPTLAGGDPLRGADLFTLHNNHCNLCHVVPRGTNNNIDLPAEVGSPQPLKNPSLRTTYQRVFFNPRAGQQSLSGFGTGFQLPTAHPYALDVLGSESFDDFADVTAFVLCFPTETKPSVGDGLTVTAANAAAAAADLAEMEAQAGAQACEFAVRGRLGAAMRSFLYNRTTQRYEPDTASEPALTRAQLLALLSPGDALTFLGTPLGEGRRYGGDRDGNGTRDRDENPPALGISAMSANARLQWPAAPAGWQLESAATLDGPWQPVTGPRANVAGWLQRDEPIAGAPTRFYRLRRTW